MNTMTLSDKRAHIYVNAAVAAIKKLSLRQMAKNPVMLVVWVGTLVTAFFAIKAGFAGDNMGISAITSVLLLFTVWFANFAEAIAEAHAQGQAESLRAAKRSLTARRVQGAKFENIAASRLRKGDTVKVFAGEIIPCDGDMIEGIATVNESAVTGESAPVLREAGTDFSSVIGGTTLLTGEVLILVANEPGHSFLDRMIGLVEGAKRQKTPNETALTVLLAALTMVFLVVVATLPAMASFMSAEVDTVMLIALLVCLIPTTIGGLLPAIGIAGMNRALAANVVAKSGKAVEIAGDIDTLLLDKTGTITFGDRQATAFIPVKGITHEALIEAAVLSSLKDRTPEGKSIIRLAEEQLTSLPDLPANAQLIEFSPKTRVSGVRIGEEFTIVKGAWDAIKHWAEQTQLFYSDEIERAVTDVAKQGGTPLVVANHTQVLGVIALTDVVKPGVAQRFAKLRALGVRTLMVTGDNPITAGVIAAKAGVDDFVAEAKPEDKLALIRQEQSKGRLVAMVGDGTNDAPALAQADIGLAMNSGTQAAKEAGNMVDLDSDPAKLLSVVEIGKQLLITRGALTTFSLANDVAKYFAILPAVFAGALPSIAALDFMQLHSPTSAVVSALLFNALIIPVLIPIALKGVRLRAKSAEKMLMHNLLIYGLGGVLLPFIAIKLLDIAVSIFL